MRTTVQYVHHGNGQCFGVGATYVTKQGKACFFGRFFVQWIASERKGTSVIPTAFWFFSLAGSLVLLAYGIHRKDLVIIIGQLPGFLIYTRNLWFIYKTGHQLAEQPPGAEQP